MPHPLRARLPDVVLVSAEEFDDLVTAALDALPPRITAMLDNVVVLVEDEPPRGQPGLLGLYVGVPLTERDSHYAAVLPDRVMLYRGPLQRRAETRAELVDQVRITVVHELAHHVGIDDDRLDELGWA